VGARDQTKPVQRFELPRQRPAGPLEVGVGGVQLWPLRHVLDPRGNLIPVEFEKELPFMPHRQFFIHDVGDDQIRGEHAHRVCRQFLFAITGSLAVIVDDGSTAREVVLQDASYGIYLPTFVWGVQYRFKPYTVLAVFASHAYDAAEYIRDYDVFLGEIRARGR
jgi:UDP-2-acetamido-3-amino-2,3-dideoxy-glucuronate N-acetyltransferase